MIAIDVEKCTGCATCAKVCPHSVIAIDGKKAYLAHEERCIECGACRLNCEDSAVDVTKGTGCLFLIIKEDILRLKSTEDSCCCGCG